MTVCTYLQVVQACNHPPHTVRFLMSHAPSIAGLALSLYYLYEIDVSTTVGVETIGMRKYQLISSNNTSSGEMNCPSSARSLCHNSTSPQELSSPPSSSMAFLLPVKMPMQQSSTLLHVPQALLLWLSSL